MYPKSFFNQHHHNPTNGTCFVLMPFDSSFNEVYATISGTMKSDALNFSCKRADEIFGGGHIIEDILRNIGNAEIIIADLTGRNPNVFYELGITHMVKDVEKVIILSQEIGDIPFDLKQYRCLNYEQSEIGLGKLKRDLERTIRAISQPVYRFSVREGENYEFPNKLPAEDRAVYYFSISSVDVGHSYAKFLFRMFKYTRGQTSQVNENFYMLHVGEERPIKPTSWLLSLEEVVTATSSAHFKVILK